MKNTIGLLLVCWATVASGAEPAGARSGVRLPRLFTDNMVLQREAPVRVWGWAAPGETVKVTLAGKEAAGQADARGAWSVELPAMKDGENLEMTVAGRPSPGGSGATSKNTVTLKNLIVGDVWLCGGQSNMEMALKRCLGAAEDIQAADLPRIRHIMVSNFNSASREDDIRPATPWLVCSPKTAGGFSGVGFYFAREVQKRVGVPIGLLADSYGGSFIESWIPPEGVEPIPELKAAPLDPALDSVSPNGFPVWGCKYNGMIHPLVRFPIKGVLWYQGESHRNENMLYTDKMRALIGGWRKQWGLGDFPFYFVQLPNFATSSISWSRIRAAQFAALAIPNTGMAVTMDVGMTKDIHPQNKYDVGTRLARWALARDYGQKDIVPSGPLFREMQMEGDKARLYFDHAATGLMIGNKDGRSPVAENKEGKLDLFKIAGADRAWQPAEAVIDGETVVVWSPKVKAPVAVRYVWNDNPLGPFLYNREGLPASSIKTDNW